MSDDGEVEAGDERENGEGGAGSQKSDEVSKESNSVTKETGAQTQSGAESPEASSAHATADSSSSPYSPDKKQDNREEERNDEKEVVKQSDEVKSKEPASDSQGKDSDKISRKRGREYEGEEPNNGTDEKGDLPPSDTEDRDKGPTTAKEKVEKEAGEGESKKTDTDVVKPRRKRTRPSGWDQGGKTVPQASQTPASTPAPTSQTILLSSGASGLLPMNTLQLQQLNHQKQQQAQFLALQQQQLMQAQLSASRANRIYVGGLLYDLNEDHIRAAFTPFGVINNIEMPREPTGKSKGFCFVEYSNAQSAELALRGMNGACLGGRAIKVGRPTQAGTGSVSPLMVAGLNPLALLGQSVSSLGVGIGGIGTGLAGMAGIQTGLGGMLGGNPAHVLLAQRAALLAQQNANPTLALLQQAAMQKALLQARAPVAAPAAPAVVSPSPPVVTLAKPAPSIVSPCKIYVGSVFWDVTETHLKDVFSAFGKVVSCVLLPNPETGKHKGYGFIEYESAQAASDAIQHMNGFELCGRQLKVGPSHAAAAAVGAVTSDPAPPASAPAPTSIEQEENLKIRGNQRFAIMQKLQRAGTESRCVVLRNMVGADEVDDELEGEVREECSKFGPVQKIVIEKSKTDSSAVGIFVLFSDVSSAVQGRESLDKRWFGGRRVEAEFYPIVKFESGIYE